MMREKERYEVQGPSEATGEWWIVHCHYKGAVLHREQIPPAYDTKDAAETAAAQLQKSVRE